MALNEASRALIMLHGRGATSESMISLKDYLHLEDAAILAPQATNNSWYPYSFMAPVEKNQPALDSALEIIHALVIEINEQEIPLNRIFILGFSQGACLALEYAARNAAVYGGIIAFTGGLIGETLNKSNYRGDFQDTPVLLSTKDPDTHVPLSRVKETAAIFRTLNAHVELKVEEGGSHSIEMEEIEAANELVFNKKGG